MGALALVYFVAGKAGLSLATVSNLVGELHKGWTCGKYLLGHERTGIAGIGSCKQQLARVRSVAAQQGMADDAVLRRRIAQFEAELMALEFTGLRLMSANQRGRVPGIEASVLKVRGTELRQAIYELLVEVAGPDAVPFEERAMTLAGAEGFAAAPGVASLAANYFDSRKLSIYGGANEVQRNLIARAVLV